MDLEIDQTNLLSQFSVLLTSIFLELWEGLQRIYEIQNIPSLVALKVII